MKRILNALAVIFCLQTLVAVPTTHHTFASNMNEDKAMERAITFSVFASDGTLYNEVQVFWTALGADYQYLVYRSESVSELGQPISKNWQLNNHFLDRGVNATKTYYYTVKYKHLNKMISKSKPDKGFAKRVVSNTADADLIGKWRIEPKYYDLGSGKTGNRALGIISFAEDIDTLNTELWEMINIQFASTGCFKLMSMNGNKGAAFLEKNTNYMPNLIREARLRGIDWIVTTDIKNTEKVNNAVFIEPLNIKNKEIGLSLGIYSTQTNKLIYSNFIPIDSNLNETNYKKEMNSLYQKPIKNAALALCKQLDLNKDSSNTNPIIRTTSQIIITNSSVSKVEGIKSILESLGNNNIQFREFKHNNTEGRGTEHIIAVNHNSTTEDLYIYLKNKCSSWIETIGLDKNTVRILMK